MGTIIEAIGLKKAYGSVQAVKGVDFHVEKGQLFAFLGPNGAGKSTTIDMLCTLLLPDEGKVTIDGHVLGKDDNKIRSSIGVVFQDSLLDARLTVKENLYTRGAFYGLNHEELTVAIGKAAETAEVTGFLDRPYGKLSGGQRRRADIARALINTPKILFLDEPTTGLDPQTRKSVWKTIKRLQKENGMTVFLTTHYMEEADEADYVVVIDDGVVSAQGTPTELKRIYSGDLLKMYPRDMTSFMATLNADEVSFSCTNESVSIRLDGTLSSLPYIEKYLSELNDFEVLTGTMDNVFLTITGQGIRE